MPTTVVSIDGEDAWQPARLIPTSGIKGVDEQEKRATSALLSVMMAVPDFSRALLRKLNAPAGHTKTYIEPEFKLEDGTKTRPDGAIVLRRGRRTWTALVEVKTQTNELRREQIEGYLSLARERGFDAVITISNQLATLPDQHPLEVDKKLTKRVHLVHWSWVEILTEAVVQKEHRGVDDLDQAWILGELIAYLKHPQSGAMQFQDMGPHWVPIRDAARDGMLKAQDPGIADVVVRWDQFIQFLCLHLAGDLGVTVNQVLPRSEREDPRVRRQALIRDLVQNKSLAGVIRVQNAIAAITLTAALNARTTTATVVIDAPAEGKPQTRVNWLLKQLRDAPDSALVAAAFIGTRETNSARLRDLRVAPQLLLLADKAKSPRSFMVSQMKEMGTKRGGVSGSFIGEATELLLSFYRAVVQELRPWAPAAPKLPTERDTDDSAEQPENVVTEVANLEAEGGRAPQGGAMPDDGGNT